MALVTRYDVGTLQPPRRTPNGALRVDGCASRVGVLEYRDGAGGVRRELRLEEDVFDGDSLANFEGVVVTDDHPSTMVDERNTSAVSRGMVISPGRRDGDYVVVSAVITDAALIQKMEQGKRQLSVGYRLMIQETPGVHPTYGKYDAIQRQIVPNHLAVVDVGRAGPGACVRMDSDALVCELQRDLTRAFLVPDSVASDVADVTDTPEPPKMDELEKAKARIKELEDELQALKSASGPKPDAETDSKPNPFAEKAKEKEKEAEEAKAKADAADKVIATLSREKAQIEAERDAARAECKTAKDAAEQARKDADDKIAAAKTDADKIRTDAEASVAAMVRDRVAVESAANAVLGDADRSEMTLRAIKVAVVKHVDGDEIADDRHDAYVEGRYDSARARYRTGDQALAQARQTVDPNRRADDSNQIVSEEKAQEALRERVSKAWMDPADKKE